MKRREYTLEPETAAEKDGITALKLAVESYCSGRDYTRLFTSGKLMGEVNGDTIEHVLTELNFVDVDDYGRDANGVDIRAALETLAHVKGK